MERGPPGPQRLNDLPLAPGATEVLAAWTSTRKWTNLLSTLPVGGRFHLERQPGVRALGGGLEGCLDRAKLNAGVVMGLFCAEYPEVGDVLRLSTEVVAPGPQAAPAAVRNPSQEEQSALAAREQLQDPGAATIRAPWPGVRIYPPHRPLPAKLYRHFGTVRVETRPEPRDAPEERVYAHREDGWRVGERHRSSETSRGEEPSHRTLLNLLLGPRPALLGELGQPRGVPRSSRPDPPEVFVFGQELVKCHLRVLALIGLSQPQGLRQSHHAGPRVTV